MRKACFIGLILVLTACFGFGKPGQFQASILFGFNHTSSYGSEEDYICGENDFPVTPAHTPLQFAASLAYFFTKNTAIELTGAYTFGSRVTLQDPSDNDTVDINTARHFSFTLNFIYRFLVKKFRPYLRAGGGIDSLITKEETYISRYGYEIKFVSPERKVDPLLDIGGGVHYFFTPKFGVMMDIRYMIIFTREYNINGSNLKLGFFMKF
ncbi:MAG: outer membrane beta-barrel protein [Candidatus Aminicenantes bacterium]|nr:MAG: outer membrane beta-barrel protein [Candidatus Aminicenantes bacterium]